MHVPLSKYGSMYAHTRTYAQTRGWHTQRFVCACPHRTHKRPTKNNHTFYFHFPSFYRHFSIFIIPFLKARLLGKVCGTCTRLLTFTLRHHFCTIFQKSIGFFVLIEFVSPFTLHVACSSSSTTYAFLRNEFYILRHLQMEIKTNIKLHFLMRCNILYNLV